MKSLLVYLKDYKKESVLGPLFKLLEASFELIVPLVVASMIDVGIAESDRNYVIRMCFIMAALGVTGLISSDGTVFCRQSSGGVCYQVKACLVCTYSEPVIFQHGRTRDFYTDYKNDQ